MITWITTGLSATAMVVSLMAYNLPQEVTPLADKYIELHGTLNVQAETFIQLSKRVEELRIEVAHVHEVNLEIGDNLNKRIDDMGVTIGSVATNAANAAEDAKVYAYDAAVDAKAYADEKSADLMVSIKEMLSTWEWPDASTICPEWVCGK